MNYELDYRNICRFRLQRSAYRLSHTHRLSFAHRVLLFRAGALTSFVATGLVIGVLGTGAAAQSRCPGSVEGGRTVGMQTIGGGDSCVIEKGAAVQVDGMGPNGQSQSGIMAIGDGTRIVNRGAISTVGISNEGIFAGSHGYIANFGSITTSSEDASAIIAGSNNVIINRGTLRTSGDFANGIRAQHNNKIVNSGQIVTTGRYSTAIDARRNTHILNSGLIKATGPGTVAIAMDGGTNVLTLLPGARVIGNLALLGGGHDTYQFRNRVSTVLTTRYGGPPEAVDTGGLPYVVADRTVAVLDPSGFGHQSSMLADLTGAIFNSVQARLASGSGGAAAMPLGGAGAAAMPLGGAVGGQFATIDIGPGEGQPARSNLGLGSVAGSQAGAARSGIALWAQAFGGSRDADGRAGKVGVADGATHRLYGGIAGLDAVVAQRVRIGAFGGASRSKLAVNTDVALADARQHIKTNSTFGGVYASYGQAGWFAHLMLTAGKSDYTKSRTVIYNLTPTGEQRATGSFDGTFVSPELTAGASIKVAGVTIVPSARLRYAHLSLKGYTETGAVAPISVGSRDISVWVGRAQLAFPMVVAGLKAQPRFGIEAMSGGDGTVSAVMLGQTVSFEPSSPRDRVTGFVGLTLSAHLAGSLSLFADGEVHAARFNRTARAEGRAGLKLRF